MVMSGPADEPYVNPEEKAAPGRGDMCLHCSSAAFIGSSYQHNFHALWTPVYAIKTFKKGELHISTSLHQIS